MNLASKLIATLTLCIFMQGLSIAQPTVQGAGPAMAKGKERIKALHAAYITEALNLTEDESQKFWPIHREYANEMINARLQNRNASELEIEEKSLQIKKKYNDRFIKILGNERTNLLYKKDKEFRNKVIDQAKKMRERQSGGRNRRMQ